MYLPLDGPSLQDRVSVTDSTVFRVKVGSSEFEDRDVVCIQPLDGLIWLYFGDGTNTPNATTVKDKGFPIPKNSFRSFEAGNTQQIFIVADSGTVSVTFAERG